MESDRRSERAKKRLTRLAVGLTGLCVVGLLVSWWHLANGSPEVVIPDPVMPVPNAFDYYVAAGKAVINEKQIDDINTLKPVIAMTLAQKEAVIVQNAAALESLHQGFAYEYRNPPLRSAYATIPYLSPMRGVARLLKAQSRVRAQQGDWGGAADSALDAIRLGEDILRGGPRLMEMTGVACQAIGQKPLWETIDHLDASQSRAVIARLTGLLESRFPYADTLQEEKWYGQAILKELFQTITPRNALAAADQWTERDAPPSRRYWTAFALLSNRRGILQEYNSYLDASVTQARRPYAARLPLPTPNDITGIIAGYFAESARCTDVSVETKNDLLLITLALHLYQLEHGHAPSALTELTPAYLQRLPDDPFALQGTFKYRLQGNTYTLYSIGPDGKDDGGTPIDDLKYAGASNSRRRYLVLEDSRGDLVAGINFP